MFLDDTGVQPGFIEFDEVRQRQRSVRRGGVQACRGRDDHGAGNLVEQRELPDSEIEENSHNFRPLGLG